MELRIDRLLNELRLCPSEILGAIDRDPLLRKREIGQLILANATKQLYTPEETHQLFAKGIVYSRDPYQLVSLPLVKIFNLGERAVTVQDLEALAAPAAGAKAPRLHFLKKYDGSMIQRFQHAGRVWYSTRGMLEGMSLFDQDDEEEMPMPKTHFNYLGSARQIATQRYSLLNELVPEFELLTLIFELIHPGARVITDYGNREDLILIAIFDRQRWGYWTHAELCRFGERHGLTVVDAFSPLGDSLAQQLDHLVSTLAESDQEGTVLTIEHGEHLVYRVKSKSPNYLRLLKLMVNCSYAATVATLDGLPALPAWPEFEALLRSWGSDKVPEEVLQLYRQHYEQFVVYLDDCEKLRQWALTRCAELRAEIGAADDPRALRKAFAQRAKASPHPAMLFVALDGKLVLSRVREYAATPKEVEEALRAVDGK